jgi:hypothetical protein
MVLKRLEDYVKYCQMCIQSERNEFFGLHSSEKGLKLIQSKVDALLNASSPKNVKELKSLYGLINYCAKFIHNAATLITPFRELTKRNAGWNWAATHELALSSIKKALVTKEMSYFNKEWRSELTTDASPTGLGAALSQFDPKDPSIKKIVLYASRGLTAVERKYSQVEKEAGEKLKLYLIGKEFDLVTDNKAVQLIFSNPNSKPCARLERWSLRLITYSFKKRHESGSTNIADFISRNASNEVEVDESYVEDYVNMYVDSNLPTSVKLDAIIQSTRNDET